MTPRDENMTVGDELRVARLRKKLTQSALAERVGVKGDRWTVGRWENDVNLPESEHRLALIRELDLPASFFDAVPERPAEARLSHRVWELEQAVERIERRLFDGVVSQDR